MFTIEDGRFAVTTARATIETHLAGKPPGKADGAAPETFGKKGGVFVTLSTYPAHDLRGCIGYPEPTHTLIVALRDAAVSAATRDPRFRPVTEKELASIVIEVSLLTPPEVIPVRSPKEYLKAVVVGRDGLIAERGGWRGLLLPQVAVEYGWSVEEFLCHTCMKAGLPADAWTGKGTRIHRFSAQVFGEEKPRGGVREIPLGK